MTSYEEAVRYILDIPRFAGKSGIENLRKYLEFLGSPEKKLKAVHIAGTNGKGSVTEMLASVLREAGYVVGTFISPHLEKINERISIDGELISDEDFLNCFEKVKNVYEENRSEIEHLSFFEYIFAMAAVYFAEKNPEFCILETGLGGRLDATNVVSPILNIITSIGMDHMQYLGNTITEIAGEKAGIITSKVALVYNTGDVEADQVIVSKAKEMGVTRMLDAGKFKVSIKQDSLDKIDFSVENEYNYEDLLVMSPAIYQTRNAATVIAATEILLKDMDPDKRAGIIRRGIKNFSWPARMEFVKKNLVIDGAHNENAAKYFVETALKICEKGPWKTKAILFAVSADKDYDSVARIIAEAFKPDKVYITSFNSDRTLDTGSIKDTFEKYVDPKSIEVFGKTDDAVEMLKKLSDDEIVFSVGSLYLAGELREKLGL